MSVIIWFKHCFGHQWGFICLTVFWLNRDLKTSVKEYFRWYLWSSHFFLTTKAANEFHCWLLSMKCTVDIYIHNTTFSFIAVHLLLHIYTCCMFSYHKSMYTKSILVKDYAFSCSFWDLNIFVFMVMSMYPSIANTLECHFICKGIVYSTMKILWSFTHSLKLFQTRMTFFLLLNTNTDILKNVGN